MRKSLLWILGGLVAVAVAGFFVLRSVLVFGPDGPPREDAQAYVADLAPSFVQTEIVLPLERVETVLSKQLSGLNPFYSGKLDRVGIDIVMGLLGLPRRTESSCTTKEIVGSAERLGDCMADAKKLGFIKQKAAEAVCLAKFGVDAVDGAVTTVKECVDKVVPLPSASYDVDYAFSIKSIELQERGGKIDVVAQIESTLTVPKSVLSFLDGKRTTKCGPAVTGRAQLTPKLMADNTKRDEGIGVLTIGFTAESVSVSPGRPCSKTSGEVQKALDKLMDVAMEGLSDVFQKTLVKTLEGLADTPEIQDAIDGGLVKLAGLLGQPVDLASLIEEHQPGVLPSGVSPTLVLNPNRIVVAKPKVVRTSSGGALILSPGIQAQPLVLFEPIDAPKPGFIKLDTKKREGNRFEVAVTGQIALDRAEPVASQQLRQIVDIQLEGLSYKTLDVSLYQARERLVVGVKASGLTWLGLSAQVFLTARPEMDPEGTTLRLRDVKFDLASQNFLLRAASYVLEAPLEANIEGRVALPLDQAFGAVLKELSDTSITLKAEDFEALDAEGLGLQGASATLELNLNTLELARVWASEDQLNATVLASGKSRIGVE
ncbi:MAG: DUF4403 family protein [Pseudomonadota bacterium]